MNMKFKNKLVVFTVMLACIFSSQEMIFAETSQEYKQYDDLIPVDEGYIAVKSIGNTNVLISRTSSTRITYTLNTSFYPIPDSISVKVWKCTYSATTGKWTPQGAAQSYGYGSVNKITKSGSFAVAAGTKYKVKVSITEKRGSLANNKVFFSSSV